MSVGIKASLALAGLVGLSASLTQTGTEPQDGIEIRSQADAARGRSWSLTADGVILHDAATRQAVALALPDWHWAGPPFGRGPDLALGPRGEVVITSDVLPRLWRIDPASLEVTVHSPVRGHAHPEGTDMGFARISYSAKHGAYYATGSADGSRWRIDPLLRRAQMVVAPTPRER
jgi:hypothetical protein